MYTLFDFLSHVKGVEYIISVLFIAGFILYLEVLKPKPFKTLVHTSKDDLSYIKERGYRNTLRTIGRIFAAPFIGLFYVISLPFIFAYAVGLELIDLSLKGLGSIFSVAGKNVTFGWRPQEAYFAGKKGRKKKAEPKKDKEEEEEEESE
jgi:hypothetical protein